jgi:casein kinase II subunit alpha
LKINEPEYPEYIKREIAILKKLDHPNIIKLYDVVKDPTTGFPTLVLEHVETGELDQDELFESFEEKDIQLYMYKILQALDYAHS